MGLLRARKYPIALVLLTSIGLLLRLPLIARFPFREDEAIYAFWALQARQDPLFLTVWPDKPPIFIWLLSATFSLFGVGEVSARGLNITLSVLTILVVATTAKRLWGRRAGAIAALAFALNPFAISFAPTAFTDPMLVLAGSLALSMSVCRRPFWAGLWLGVAVMTKQQGVLYAPLILGIWVAGLRLWANYSNHEIVKVARDFAIGLLLVILPILAWDSLRWAVAPSPWDLSIRNYGVLRLLPPSQWADRVVWWLPLLWYLTASWAVWILLLLASLILVINRFWVAVKNSNMKTTGAQRHGEKPGAQQPPCHPFTLSPFRLVTPSSLHILSFWSVAFIGLHVITTIQTWDRYLLPLAPILALCIGYWVAQSGQSLPTRQFLAVGMSLLLLLFLPAFKAATGQLPIGADHGAYSGLHQAIAWIQEEVSEKNDTAPIILYHRVLGWHHQFYFAEQIREGKVKLRWFSDSIYLIDNAQKAPHLRKFLVQPTWAPNRDLEMRAAIGKMTLRQRARFGNFIVLELSQPAQPICTWCLCHLQTETFAPFTIHR